MTRTSTDLVLTSRGGQVEGRSTQPRRREKGLGAKGPSPLLFSVHLPPTGYIERGTGGERRLV